MALIKDIDVTNYETKSESVVITDPNGSYTLGSLIESVKMHDMFLGTGFTITQGATTYIEGRDFALTQSEEDISMTTNYGVPLYSSFKSYRLSGTVTVSYRQVATYDRAGLILRHESRLNDHDVLIDAVEAVNVNQDNAISDLASDLGVHKANNVIHVSTYDRARWDGRMQAFVADNIAARDALTGMKVGDTCNVIVGANEDGKTEKYIYSSTGWQEITDTDPNPDVMRMTNRAAAPSATSGRLSLYAIADKLFGRTSSGAVKRFADIADGAAVTSGAPAVFQSDGTIAAGGWQGSGGSGSGNVTGPASSVVDEIATFNNTTGTLLKSSGKKIGNASGNVPLANGTECVNLFAASAYRLKRMPILASGSVIGTAWDRGAGTAFYVNNASGNITDMPPGETWANVEVYGTTGDSIHIILRASLSLITYAVQATSQGNGGWKKIQNATGGAGESQRLYTGSAWLISKMPDGMIIAVYGYNGSVGQLGSLGEVNLTLPVSVFSVMPIVLALNANSNSAVLGGWMTDLTTVHIKNNSTLVSDFKFALIGY